MSALPGDSITLAELREILRGQYDYASETHFDGTFVRLQYRIALDELWSNVLAAIRARKSTQTDLHPILNAALVKP